MSVFFIAIYSRQRKKQRPSHILSEMIEMFLRVLTSYISSVAIQLFAGHVIQGCDIDYTDRILFQEAGFVKDFLNHQTPGNFRVVSSQ
jgi:hypothetical protein